jgi:hypothetical protein
LKTTYNLRVSSTALALAFAPVHAQAPIDLRIALVIGNAAYVAAPLLNPVKDAKAMTAVLQGMGFRVVEVRDGGKAQMEQAIHETRELLKGHNGIGLLYFAGHGLQVDWHNYMLPIDAKPTSSAEAQAQAVDIQTVIDAFKTAGNRMNILVLDACRDNPFRNTASARGLAPLDAPPGTFLAYATAPGNVAEDGSDEAGNGLYTGFLVKELGQPQARIEDVFKRVRLQVRQASQGRQVPWESTSLEDDFIFANGKKAEPSTTRERDIAYEAEKLAWDRIKDSTASKDLFAFLQRFPSGALAEQAQFKLDQLASSAVTSMPGPDGIRVLPSGVNRYRVGDVLTIDRSDNLTGTTRRVRLEVTFADDRRVLINDGELIWNQMGGEIKSRFGNKDPATLKLPAELAVGKRWLSSYKNTTADSTVQRHSYQGRVLSIEDIEVPAGRFATFHIEHRGQVIGPTGSWNVVVNLWVDPRTMMIVREAIQTRTIYRNHLVADVGDVLVSLKAPR